MGQDYERLEETHTLVMIEKRMSAAHSVTSLTAPNASFCTCMMATLSRVEAPAGVGVK